MLVDLEDVGIGQDTGLGAELCEPMKFPHYHYIVPHGKDREQNQPQSIDE